VGQVQSAAIARLDCAGGHLARNSLGLGGRRQAFETGQRLRLAGQENPGAPRRDRGGPRRDSASRLSCGRGRFPSGSQGFLIATIAISVSAIFFLAVIGWLRDRALLDPEATVEKRAKDDERERKEIEAFTLGLLGVAFLVALAIWINPNQVGRFLGSMVVVYFAFGAILALINAFEFAVVWTTGRGWFGRVASPRVVGAYAVAFMISLAAINAWLHPFHRVRLCDGGDCVAPAVAPGYTVATLPDERPTVAAAARAWYAQAKALMRKRMARDPFRWTT
jgi:hypothetical protein